MRTASKIKIIIMAALAIALLEACSVTPVSAWQRGNLAKQQMVRDAAGLHSALEQHTYASKEGTAGGYSVGGGGCGCN
jgi:LPS O-antigen subunit length determinant protein (WzzB/FepE family)